MMTAKLSTPELHKITVFSNEDYGIINSVHDLTNKILSRNSIFTTKSQKVWIA